MKATLYKYNQSAWVVHSNGPAINPQQTQLVLCFGAKEPLQRPDLYPELRQQFPAAEILIVSTAGEIVQDSVVDDSVFLVALEFEQTRIQTASVNRHDFTQCFDAAKKLICQLPGEGLKYVLVFSDGSLVNGSELVRGLKACTRPDVLVTGGLAGDGAQFRSTLTGLNANPSDGIITAVGFYGEKIRVHHGSQGGWDIFGPERTVTKSSYNVVQEIDGKSALAIYKKYLGPEAAQLPGSALLFPLSLISPDNKTEVVRTILTINEEEQSMTFAGDLPQGSRVRFMKANFDKITAAANVAAQQTLSGSTSHPDFALLISCVGRKLILGQRIEEEVEAVREALGPDTLLAGFYSYGEISPFQPGGQCQLHNQTMTITTFHELP